MSKSFESKDVSFVRKLLLHIEQHGIPAPSPIEQRWTASSTSPLSPAHSEQSNDVFCWVGLIMYLPPSQSEVYMHTYIHTYIHTYPSFPCPLFTLLLLSVRFLWWLSHPLLRPMQKVILYCCTYT